MKILNIKSPMGKNYNIFIQNGFSSLKEALFKIGYDDISQKKACIVTDSKVGELYGELLKKELSEIFSTVTIFSFPHGEENKTLDTVRDLYSALIEGHFDRKDLLFALGGGVTGDLCGYGAATYLRGVDFIQVPTSLLAMVDSSIGGKTGVDFDSYKNMVGAFHSPRLVYMNLELLNTLDSRELSCGMAEIIKHGFIRDKEYLLRVIDCKSHILHGHVDHLEEIIYESCRIKGAVVEEDPTEQGIRAWLNFGHTLGHAIEKYMNFTLLHGECVALGCVAAAYISCKRGLITESDLTMVRDSLKAYNLPVNLHDILDKKSVSIGDGGTLADESIGAGNHVESFIKAIVDLTKSDKKAEHGFIKFILLKAIGEAFIDKTVTEDEMRAALLYMAR